MRSGIRWDVSLMHGVTSFEKHGERHAGAVEPRPGRAAIAGIDIRYDDVAKFVHVIAEPGRNMVFAFPDNTVLPGRGGKAGPARGNGRFANKCFALEEIGALFADMDHDSCLAGDAIAVPRIGHRSWSGRRSGCSGRLHLRATGEERQDRKSHRAPKQGHPGHKDAQSNTFPSRFNTKHSPVTTPPNRSFGFENTGGRSVILAQ